MKIALFNSKHKPFLYLLTLQFVIMALAFCSFVIHKQNSLSHGFTVDDYELIAGTLTEDLAVIDDSNGHKGTFVTMGLPLEAGSYQVNVQYLSTATGNTLTAAGASISNVHFRYVAADLKPNNTHATLNLELDRPTPNLSLYVNYGGSGILELQSISIQETTSYYKRHLLYALGICVLLNLLYWFFHAPITKRKTAFLLGTIFLASCYPLFLDYLIPGHDLPFHLLRIEGIHKSVRQGIFPVKIDPVWAHDYGYAVSVFYGNALLYIPTFFRLLGFTVQAAYKLFVASINLGTVLISYYSFRAIFKSSKAGLWGSLFYTLSLYRLSDLYVRAAVGEYCAMMFLPLVLLGFFLAFTQGESKNQWKISCTIALGLTGIIQSHVLTCEMIAFFVIFSCLILIRKVLQLRTFLTLASAAILTLLINLGFLVPFLDYYNSDINIASAEWGGGSFDLIQGKGMFPTQLLSLFQNTNGGSWDTIGGINEAAYAPGIVLILGVVLFLYLALCEKKISHPLHKPALLCTVLGCVALWMSTCYFPYDKLSGMHEAVASVIRTIQFPWRFLALATILLVFTLIYTISVLCPSAIYELSPADTASETTSVDHAVPSNSVITNSILLGGLFVILIVNVSWFFYNYTITGNTYRVYEIHDLDSMAISSAEYIPVGTDTSLLLEGRVLTDNCSFTDYTKDGTIIHATVSAGEGGGCIQFPLLYYRYYTCQDISTGTELTTDAGFNNMVRITLPENYNGSIKVFFREPLHWRIAEIISLLAFIGTIICCGIFKTPQHS